MEKVARKILASTKAMVPGRFTVEPVTRETHPYADWKAYDAVRETAEGLGLRHLDDVDVTSTYQDPAMTRRAVLAIYVSEDGTIVVGHYRMALRWTFMGIMGRLMGASGDMFDVGTNFGGGHGVMLETTTAQASGVWSMPDFIPREVLKHGTPLPTALQRHRERLAELPQNPAARPTVVRTLQDIVAISNIVEERKLAWRKSLGWATRDEIAGLTKMSGATLDKFYAAFRKVADET